MPKLSKDRLNDLKYSKNFTSREIAEKTGIPKSTVEKIFGGFNKNPTIDNLQKIANVLECSIDDFLDYESEPVLPFYTDRAAAKCSEYILENPKLKLLLESAKNLDDASLSLLIEISKKFE